MERAIEMTENYPNIGDVVSDVVSRGEEIILKQDGEAIAVVMPAELYKQWQQGRQAFFARMAAISEHTNLTDEEADVLIAEAITSVRRAET